MNDAVEVKSLPYRRLLLVLAVALLGAALALVRGMATSIPGRTDATDATGATGATAVTNNATVTLTEFQIQPQSLHLPTGQPVTIEVVNRGAVVHDWRIPELGIGTRMLRSGEHQIFTVDLRAVRPGSYTMVCGVAGHAVAGMTGEVRVD